MNYVVYCDESRPDGAPQNAFMAIGGLWVPAHEKQRITKALRHVLREQGLGAEVKWHKTSRVSLDRYKKLIDFFFAETDLCYRVIIVNHQKIDVERFHRGEQESGFYAFYFHMLIKWLESGNSYTILLDQKQNKNADSYTALRKRLEIQLANNATIKELTIISSEQSPLCQLTDLLTGAVAADWCGTKENTAKSELARYIAERLGSNSLRFNSVSPAICKFNIFKIELS